jgi:hypothetical protein
MSPRRRTWRGGQVTVSTEYQCTGCEAGYLHLEVWNGDDVPHGLPLEARLCPCGTGLLVEALRDDADPPDPMADWTA